MAAIPVQIPAPRARVLDDAGFLTTEWRNFFNNLARICGQGQGNVVGLISTNGTIYNISTTTVPTGVMLPYVVGASAPDGWLLANHAAVSRTTYAALFTLIGTSFGPGDGMTTFNLPNGVAGIPLVADASPLVLLGMLPWIIRT